MRYFEVKKLCIISVHDEGSSVSTETKLWAG